MKHDARDLILAALEQASTITAAGASSLLAIAARALDPSAPITREGLTKALGLHPAVVIAALVTADMAGDGEARRALGRKLFSSLELRGAPPELTAAGQLAICIYGLEQLEPLEPLLGGVVAEAIELARVALPGKDQDAKRPDPEAARRVEAHAEELQRTKVVPIEKGSRTRIGIPPEEAARRRGAQAVRAVLKGLQEESPTDHLSSTVAGEVAACLCLERGGDAALRFLVALAARIEALPVDQAARPSPN